MTAFSDRIDALAIALTGEQNEAAEDADKIAYELSHIAGELRELERLMPDDDGFPNVRQSLALGRFLNQAMRDDRFASHPRDAYATVSRSTMGVGGIGERYLGVRFADGYEGGIDREGRVST